VYSDAWSIERVAERMEAIRNTESPFVAAGHADHMRYSFEMAASGRGSEPSSD
jgi:hypothetical protein